ncbi:methionine aminopeptidase, type I [Bacteroides luti]|uniref:Methionine aminopeptidase n=1 Tax=Bacteroides luti TaxID=1297750 RepID=A0A1M4SJE4_9BACE|nr:type I methionyl aminopeptidase [Bacteroides luti]SHE32330.1 methionine aminopeptidase, type I [Bacteroides luti]
MSLKRIKNNWHLIAGEPLTELDKKVLYHQSRGNLVPKRKLIKTPEQIEGIRKSGIINTGVLDLVAEKIHVGMSTAEIDKLVYDYTIAHGAIPADLNYEGYPKSVCTSINDVVCHGIPSEEEILKDGDIVNVDVSTIYNGYFSDASRMFMIGEVKPEVNKLVQVTKECLEIGVEKAKPWSFLGDIGAAIQRHAEKNGYSVVRDFCGHGVGLKFHEEPDVEHYGKKGKGMLLVPGMVFTIEPMINMGTYDIFIDEADGWTVCTEDGLPSAQWEHTLVITETGSEILTY